MWVSTSSHKVFFGRLGSHSPAYHSMDMYRMPPTLHTSQSCKLCCIAELEPGIVSASGSAFHVFVGFSSSPPDHLYRCYFLRIPRFHTRDLREHAVDGSIVIRWDWHFDPPFFCSLHLIIAAILALHPIRSWATFVQICANTQCNSLLSSPHPETVHDIGNQAL